MGVQGYCWVGVVAYFTRDWRWIQWGSSLIAFANIPVC